MLNLRRSLVSLSVGLGLSLPWVAQPQTVRRAHRRTVRYTGQTWIAKPVAFGLGSEDITAGEDPVLRQAAVDALGDRNGTAVVVDPNTGRILAMVNQRLALSAQYQPCSTTKLAVALAALGHGVVTENQPVHIARHDSATMVEAMAYSINAYFEALGRRMGFDAVTDFEREVGLGERAGWNIPGEQPGQVPTEPGPGGVSKLSSFGEGVYISPLQLAALATAIANGGTLYYLQHPTSPAQVADFTPRIKRHLNIANYTPVVKDGMLAAVMYGTARGARERGEQILGKTGTCSRDGIRFGLFVSYLGIEHPQLVVVVILRGNGSVSGPRAADVAGKIYRALDRERLFTAEARPSAWPALMLPGGY